MILQKLTLDNFRVFYGKHDFDLYPGKNHEKNRSVILIGGLNGSGKTSILTAIQLALYGRQCLGFSLSQKKYEDYLKNSIHKTNQSTAQPDSAEISLIFSHTSLGLTKLYNIRRFWSVKGNRVIENLSVQEKGKELSDFGPGQYQAFLNALIPIGISSLFFFDGEKISELAEDQTGSALEESVKNLLGINIIQKLRNDLSTIQKNESSQLSDAKTKKQIQKLELDLRHLKTLINQALEHYENARKTTRQTETILARLETELLSKGGARASDRENEIANQASLEAEKATIESALIELLSGSFPIALAEDFVKHTLEQIKQEQAQKRKADVSNVIVEKLIILHDSLKNLLNESDANKVKKVIDEVFAAYVAPIKCDNPVHDVSESLYLRIQDTIMDAITKQRKHVRQTKENLSSVANRLEKTKFTVSCMSEDNQIKSIMEEISKWQEKRTDSLLKERKHISEYKGLLRNAIELTKKLQHLSDKIVLKNSKNRILSYTVCAKKLLADFCAELIKSKLNKLEAEFIYLFRKLSGKEDFICGARIDPNDFSVDIFSSQGKSVNKNDLSAGEKQLYAIAILGALRTISEKKLPIIIDTPLARLDAAHRKNLITHYLPSASHQVIILSTDTEIDKKYYAHLAKYISRAFMLDYSPSNGSTRVIEGYFDSVNRQELKNVT